jgi:predicted nucleic acid-binding Zn ribbon protein
MRDYNNQPIGAVIKEWLNRKGWDKKMKQLDAVDAYYEIVGPFIVKHTTKAEMRGKTLALQIDSGVIKQELTSNREFLLQQINEKMGLIAVDKIEVW